MTQEEKARAYDEALGRAKSWAKGEHPECFSEARKAAEFIFPELKESEDGRIIKAIYNALKYLERELSWDFLDEVDILDAYAWLEKQGFKASETSIKDAEEEIRQYVSDEPIAEFMERYANWNRQREEWDRSLLEALIQRGKPY